MITNTGLAGVASRINGAGSEAAFTYLAIGTGSTAAAATQTALVAESTTDGLGRASATASRVTTTVTNDTAQLVHTWSATGTHSIVEAGIFNAASAGIMLARQVFSAINVENGDSIAVTFKVQAS